MARLGMAGEEHRAAFRGAALKVTEGATGTVSSGVVPAHHFVYHLSINGCQWLSLVVSGLLAPASSPSFNYRTPERLLFEILGGPTTASPWDGRLALTGKGRKLHIEFRNEPVKSISVFPARLYTDNNVIFKLSRSVYYKLLACYHTPTLPSI